MTRLVVDGEDHVFDLDPETPLLWALRDAAGKTGVKYGCGVAACGACTVLVDGVAARSCALAVGDMAEGTRVTTIHGVGVNGELHPVQAAWIAEQVPQCGYCQSGQIVAAIALLTETPDPTDADIDAAMTNLCRCGTYPRIRRAIARAATAMREARS